MPKKKYINFEKLNRDDIWIVVFDLDGTLWDGMAFKEDCANLKRISDKMLVDNERVAIRLYPCVRETLKILHNQPGVFLGIASWNVKGTEYCLKKLDLAKYFHKELKYIVSDEEVKKGVKMSGTDKHLMVQEIIRIVEEWTNEKVAYGHLTSSPP